MVGGSPSYTRTDPLFPFPLLFRAVWPGGTGLGDLIHSMTKFKTFSGGMFYTHIARAVWGRGGMNRAAYALALPIALTLMGGLILQMRAIRDGKDPRPMNDDNFWLAAMAQGGGLPILGDFMFSPQSRTGGDRKGVV